MELSKNQKLAVGECIKFILSNKRNNNMYKLGGFAGCLTGDTVINFNRAKRGFAIELKVAYERFNNISQNKSSNWDQDINTHVRSFNGETIQLHPIQNIVCNGIKEVYKITLENGLELKGTSDHKVMTNKGWIKLSNLIHQKVI